MRNLDVVQTSWTFLQTLHKTDLGRDETPIPRSQKKNAGERKDIGESGMQGTKMESLDLTDQDPKSPLNV